MDELWPDNDENMDTSTPSPLFSRLPETSDTQTSPVDSGTTFGENNHNSVALSTSSELDHILTSPSLDSDQTTSTTCLELDNSSLFADNINLPDAVSDSRGNGEAPVDETGPDVKLCELNLCEDSPKGATANFVCMAPADGGDVFVVGNSVDAENEGKTVPIEDVDEDDDVSDDLDDFPAILSTSEQRPSTGRFNDDDDDERRRESEEAEEIGPMDLSPPPDTWHPLIELRRRELGRTSAPLFSSRAGGSVELARRLTLYHKLDQHAGCVNALHFNESGSNIVTSVGYYINKINKYFVPFNLSTAA